MQKWTVNRLIAWAIEFFRAKEIEDPRLSAELLLSSVLGLSRMQLYLQHDYELDESQLKKYKELILKRLSSMPIQYILSEAYFRKIRLYVDENVLIPRNETELLVDKALSAITEISQSGKRVNVLEVGIGSGAISISLLKEIDKDIDLKIAATDINEKIISVCQRNISENLPEASRGCIGLFTADIIPGGALFGGKAEEKIDILISNPPYIREQDYPNLPKQVLSYEPKQALVAGSKGSEVYERIIDMTFNRMSKKSSYIIFETDPLVFGLAYDAINDRYPAFDIEIMKDYNGLERIVIARSNT